MTKPAKKKAVRTKPVHVEKYRDLAIPIYSKPVGKYESYLISYYSAGKRTQERASTLEAAKTKAKAAIKQITEGSGRLVALTAVEVADYIAAVARGAGEGETEALDPRERAIERALSGLRLAEGVAFPELSPLGLSPDHPEVRDLAAQGLLATDPDRLRVTADGRRLLDAVLERLLVR